MSVEGESEKWLLPEATEADFILQKNVTQHQKALAEAERKREQEQIEYPSKEKEAWLKVIAIKIRDSQSRVMRIPLSNLTGYPCVRDHLLIWQGVQRELTARGYLQVRMEREVTRGCLLGIEHSENGCCFKKETHPMWYDGDQTPYIGRDSRFECDGCFGWFLCCLSCSVCYPGILYGKHCICFTIPVTAHIEGRGPSYQNMK